MVDIIGRAKVIAETLVDERQAAKAGEKAGDAAAKGVAKGGDAGGKTFSSNFEGIVGKSLPLAAVGVGAAVGVVLADAIGKQIERDATAAKLSASLGLTDTETAELAKSTSKIYREAWGASFEDVQRGVAATKSAFRDLNGEELTEAARNAQIFADIFEVDVVEAAAVASVAVKQGLAKDAVEAFDLMTAAAQQVPIQFRSELLDAVTEYSQFFHQIGIDGPEAFALLAEGAALGQYGIDKTGDAIKEFGIRSIDASTSTADAFKKLNLDINDMQTALAGGGDEGEAAFRKIVQGLDDIEDPAEQAQTAIALFGTPVEDLGNEKIPAFVDALANANTQLDDFKGKTKEAGKQSGTFKTQITSLTRYLDQSLGSALSNATEGFARMYDAWVKLPARLRGEVEDNPFANGDTSPRMGRGSASGGRIGSGLRLVGENGPEIIEAGSGGAYVHNNSETRRMAAAGGGVTVNIANYGPVSGSDFLFQSRWAAEFAPRFSSKPVVMAG